MKPLAAASNSLVLALALAVAGAAQPAPTPSAPTPSAPTPSTPTPVAPPTVDPYPTPAPELAPFARLAGSWELELDQLRHRSNEWRRLAVEVSAVGAELRDRFVRQSFVVTYPGIPRPVRTDFVYSWDRFQHLYRVAACDDWAGLLDVFEGKLDGDLFVIDNTRSKTYFGAERLATRLTLRFAGEDRLELDVEASSDDGGSWAPLYRGTLRRLGAAPSL